MPEPTPNHSQAGSSPDSQLPGRWLFDSQRSRFLLPITGAWILGLDWLLFSQDAFTFGLAMPILVIVGFLLGSSGTLFLQRRFAKDGWTAALGKAMLAGIAVGVPWPIFGTMLGGWILLASGLGKRSKEQSDEGQTK